MPFSFSCFWRHSFQARASSPSDISPVARLRPAAVLLDQVDLYWRLYHLPRKRVAGVRKLKGWSLHWDVVLERSRALWWLTGCQQRWGDPQMLPSDYGSRT